MSGLVEDVNLDLIDRGITADVQTMALDKVFWSHFCINLGPATWVLGALIIGIGLDFRTGVIAILLGNVLGSLPVGLNAMLGPRTGLTQIEISRFSFGRLGTRIPSAFNWVCAVGWDAVNNVPSVLGFLALGALFGIGIPFWVGLTLLVSIQLVASMYGHHVVQILAKYLCYVLIVVFTITGVVAVMKGGSFAVVHEAIKPATFMLAVSMAAGYTMGFAPFASDYTRYLPAKTNPRVVFALSFGGIAIASVLLELCGMLTASRLTDLSPAGVIAEIGTLTGPFAPIALVAISLSAIATNSVNDNTASYSMISAGVRIPRHIAAIITTACGFVLAYAGAGKFATYLANYLFVLLYWIAPWAGIVLTDWLLFRGDASRTRRWGVGATIFLIVTPVTIVLFSSTEIYTGPIATLLGGTDIGSFVGFFAAALAYALAAQPDVARNQRERDQVENRIDFAPTAAE
jgi:NCS1 family nucleobase:cation symporter-1